jgi:hypothetical protein
MPGRAYIERASAVAERQRESEELLIAAGRVQPRRVGAGEATSQDAVSRGAHADEALALLDRLNRIDQGSVPALVHASLNERSVLFVPEEEVAPRRMVGWAVGAAALVLLVAAAAVLAPGRDGRLAWRPSIALPSAVPAPVAITVGQRLLPLPRRGEGALARARALAASGRLRDALGAIDRVRGTDPERAEADRLRGEIQQQLIGLAATPTPAAEAAGAVR